MKIQTFLFVLFVLPLGNLFAQSVPQAFNYQGVWRNLQGEPLANQSITVQVSIIKDSPSGTPIYIENQSTKTNGFGLFNLPVGLGQPVLGNFAGLDWSDGQRFLKVEVNGNLMGTTQLLSVPFAIFAEKTRLEAGVGIEVDGQVIENTGDLSPTNELQTLNLNGNVLSISSGNSVALPTPVVFQAGPGIKIDGTVITNTGDADASPSNELQELKIDGQQLSISGGNSVLLPAPPVFEAGVGLSFNGAKWENTGDLSNTNELQNLMVTGTKLSISGGNTVDLPQAPTISAGTGIAVNGGQIINMGDLSATNELQNLVISGNTLTISGGNTVQLPAVPSLSAGAGIAINGSQVINTGDLSTTNELQTLTLAGNTLSISGGNSISLPAASASQWTTASSNIYFNTGKVGIGSTSPSAKLDVVSADNIATTEIARFMPNNLTQGPVIHWGGIQQGGTITNANFEINAKGSGNILLHAAPSGAAASSGNVGIKTATPTKALHVNGGVRVENEYSMGGAGLFEIDANGVTGGRMRVQADGKITMGNTTTPGGYRLYVADGILTERVKVALKSTGNWADYVFSDTYRLRPLTEVEAFVKENRHLPGIPSASEMVENGLDVAASDAKLLEKVEELTLYLIELQKANGQLSRRLLEVENQLSNLKKE